MDELGEKIGVKGATISRYESGVISVPSPKVESLAVALDVTPGYLMGWTDMPGQMDVFDMPGMTAEDRAAAYADSTEQQVRKSEKRCALEALVNSATEEEIDLITQLVEAVIKNRK
jgi:transcriptional regulator with XRE-family HTH domain